MCVLSYCIILKRLKYPDVPAQYNIHGSDCPKVLSDRNRIIDIYLYIPIYTYLYKLLLSYGDK